MENIIRFFLNGLVSGCALAVVTMGLAIVVNTVGVWHVAHGGVYVVAAYVAWVMVAQLELPLWLSIILTIAASGITGAILEFAVYQRLRRTASPGSSYLLASIGSTYIIQNVCALFAGTFPKGTGQETKVIYNVGRIFFTNLDIALVIICAATFILLHYFLNHTGLGISIKAVASNPGLATIWGADFDKISLIVIVVASVTVAPVSLIRLLDIGIVPFAGWDVITLAMMAYILGGVGNTIGAGLAGLGLGLVTSFLTWQMPNLWVPLVIFSIIYAFMWVRPKGILGKKIWTYEV